MVSELVVGYGEQEKHCFSYLPKLWPISCAMTKTLSKWFPSLTVQEVAGLHMPDTGERPTIFGEYLGNFPLLPVKTFRSNPVRSRAWSQCSWWPSGWFCSLCHWKRTVLLMGLGKNLWIRGCSWDFVYSVREHSLMTSNIRVGSGLQDSPQNWTLNNRTR